MVQLGETSGGREEGSPGPLTPLRESGVSGRLGAMSEGATTQLQAGPGFGSLVVHKTMTDHQAFAAQVRWLTRARNHPVATLCHVDASSLTYATRFEGSHTLVTAAHEPRSGRLLLHRLAQILIILHADGLVHGNLEPGHIVVDGGRLTLISPRSAADESGPDRHHDIARFGATMSELIELWSVLDRADATVLNRWRLVAHDLGHDRMPSTRRLLEVVEALPVAGRRRWLPISRP